MLTPAKRTKLSNAIKSYRKKYLDKNHAELDESGTRLMINTFLSDVLGYAPIEEIKTEYMIKGTYADYVIQTNGIRHLLVEVKAYSLELSDKHLRQTINYGANEGIEWALLTNGRHFRLYKILFNKPIEEREMFAIDLTDISKLKTHIEQLQYLHKDAVVKKGLRSLWNKCEALHPLNIAGILYSKDVLKVIRKLIKAKFKEKFDDEEVSKSLNAILLENIDPLVIKHYRAGRTEKRSKKMTPGEKEQLAAASEIEPVEQVPPSMMN